MMNRRAAWLAAVLLAALACGLIASHVQLRGGSYELSAPQAAARADERMTVSVPDGPVAVNHASAEELQTISGIGPALALRILEEREHNGPFSYPEDLLNVKGIGEKVLQKLIPQIHLN